MSLPTPIYNASQLTDAIHRLGFLPLLDSGIKNFSANALVDEECRYTALPDGGWDWPLWKWKGQIITDGKCVYGKFFAGKAGFISAKWWPDFCNYRRGKSAPLEPESIEDAILTTLRRHGSLITRDLRAACGFTGPKMRSLFDRYITRLEMDCRIVTESFVYPTDKHGKEYGWGRALLTTPEALYGPDFSFSSLSPEESLQKILNHLCSAMPEISPRKIEKLIR